MFKKPRRATLQSKGAVCSRWYFSHRVAAKDVLRGGWLWSPLQIISYGVCAFRPHIRLNLLPKTLFPDAQENPKEEPKPSRGCTDWTLGRESAGSHQRAFQRASQTEKGEVKGEARNFWGWLVAGVFVHSFIRPFIPPVLPPLSKKQPLLRGAALLPSRRRGVHEEGAASPRPGGQEGKGLGGFQRGWALGGEGQVSRLPHSAGSQRASFAPRRENMK